MKITNITKLLLSILTLAVIIWLGGSVLRAIVAYNIFVPATQLELKQDQTDEIRMHTVRIYTDAAIYTTVSFGIVFLIAIFLFLKYRGHLKIRGWLFMSFVLFFIASPVEFYMIYLDIKLMLYVNFNQNLSFRSYEVTEYFINRLRNLGVISTLAYLSFFTSIIVIIFKPLDRSNRISVEQET